jgi:hypothetical protein
MAIFSILGSEFSSEKLLLFPTLSIYVSLTIITIFSLIFLQIAFALEKRREISFIYKYLDKAAVKALVDNPTSPNSIKKGALFDAVVKIIIKIGPTLGTAIGITISMAIIDTYNTHVAAEATITAAETAAKITETSATINVRALENVAKTTTDGIIQVEQIKLEQQKIILEHKKIDLALEKIRASSRANNRRNF